MYYIVLDFYDEPTGELLYCGDSKSSALAAAQDNFEASEGYCNIRIYNSKDNPLEYRNYYNRYYEVV